MAARQTKRIFEELSDKFLKCDVCNISFDENKHVPVHYPCTHTTCQECVNSRFVPNSDDEVLIRCPECMNAYKFLVPTRTYPMFEHNYTLLSIKNFISSKKFCEKCSDQLSEAFCSNCDLNLCRKCSNEIHVNSALNHDVKLRIKKRTVPTDACHVCEKQSNIYCPTCKLFFCDPCGDVQHHDESVGTHIVYKVNQYIIPPLAPEDEGNLVMRKLKAFGMTIKNAVLAFIEGYKLLIWILQACFHNLLASVTLKNTALMLSLTIPFLGMFMGGFPAYTILPFEDVEPVNVICRLSIEKGIYQYKKPLQIKRHRRICMFNVFHYDLRNRNRTYFVVDINVEIDREPYIVAGVMKRLLTIKLFDLNKKHNIYLNQRSIFWALFWSRNLKRELTLCISKDHYERDVRLDQTIISSVKTGQNKTVSFLFIVDNDNKTMEIRANGVRWKDEVLLKNYYKEQTLSVWITLEDPEPDTSISARLRSGSDITINDMPMTYLEIIIRLAQYLFRCLFYHVWTAVLSLIASVKETLYPKILSVFKFL